MFRVFTSFYLLNDYFSRNIRTSAYDIIGIIPTFRPIVITFDIFSHS